MELLQIDQIIAFTQGDILNKGTENYEIKNISTDSRTIGKNELFIPLVGENFDGHNFIQSAFDKECQAIITEKQKWNDSFSYPSNCWVIGVEDTLKAYQAIAKGYIKQFKNLIKVAITGSNGKTTTKEIIKAILSTHFNLLANEGNFNNQVGVPKTVLTIDNSHEVALIEMGSGKKRDIINLSTIVEPDIGIITSIGSAHTEFLGGIEGVAEEKKGLFYGFHPKSIGILNKDDPFYNYLSNNISNEILSFSVNEESLFTVVQNLGVDGYVINYKGKECQFKLGGSHNLSNLCFGILLAEHLSVPENKIIQGINSIAAAKMRSEIIQGEYTIIKDCYNANPSSMIAGLDYFNSIPTNNKKICVLGNMLELGDEKESLHEQVGQHFSNLKIDYLFTIGQLGLKIADGAKASGLPEKNIYIFQDHQSLLDQLKKIVNKNDYIYFKASRGMELEKIVNEL